MLTDRMSAPPITYSEIHKAVDGMVNAMLTEHRDISKYGLDGYPAVTGTLMGMLTGAINDLDHYNKEKILRYITDRQRESEHAYTMKQLSQKS